MTTPSNFDLEEFKQGLEVHRDHFHKSLDVCIDWVGLILATAPANRLTDQMYVIEDTSEFEASFKKSFGEELTNLYYLTAMINIQHEIFSITAAGDRITICTAWAWAHHLEHLVYPPTEEEENAAA